MDRRKFILAAGASLAASTMEATSQEKKAVAPEAETHPGGPSPHRPNIIVMICDDLGYGDLGCYGSKIATPNIDRLAKNGVRFTHYSTPHPLCSAARAAVMTGRYPTRVGVTGAFIPLSNDGLSLESKTIANVMQDADYKTMAIGKWHLGDLKPYLPTNRGFDKFYGVPYSVDMDPLPLLRDTEILEPESDRNTLTQQYTQQAVEFIAESKDKPFFLYFAQSYPHIPLHASVKFHGKSKLGLYGDVVEEIDWSMGEVMRALQENGLEKNTLVIFTGDHGPWYEGSTGDLRGRKGMAYEGGLRVPMIASMPGVLPQNRTCNGVASHMDLLPTIANLCAAKLPADPLDGYDIWPLLKMEQEEIDRKPLLSFVGWNPHCARWKQWKLHVTRPNVPTFLPTPEGGRVNMLLRNPELYNLEDDPKESYDLASRHPEVVATIQKSFTEQLLTFPERVQHSYSAAQQHLSSPWMPVDAYSPATVHAKPNSFGVLRGAKAQELIDRFK